MVGDMFSPSNSPAPDAEEHTLEGGPSARISDSIRLPNVAPITTKFCPETNRLNALRYQHTCKYMDNAQKFLGLYDVKSSVYSRLSNAEKQKTHMVIAKNYNLPVDAQWCAAAVTEVLKQGGIKNLPNGDAALSVIGYINWAGNNWHKSSKNSNAIKAQMQQMSQGDLIIWNQRNNAGKQMSHIGFIEFVDLEKGTVTFIAGNNYDAEKKHLGYVRKTMSIKDLIDSGYGG